MTSDQYAALWKEFNEIEVEKMFNFILNGIISKLFQIAPEDKKNDLQKEADLGWTMQIIGNLYQHFEPKFEIANEEISNFVSKHKEDLNYYQKRLDEAKTTLLKWRYSLACYFLARGNYIFDALRLILDSSKLSLKEKNYLSCVQLLVIAFNLNKIYNTKFDNEINKETLQIIEELKDEPRYLIEPSHVLANLGLIRNSELSNCIDLLVSKGEEEERDHIFETLLNIATKLCDLEGKSELKNSIILKLGQRLEKRGDDQTEGLLMIHHYEKAQKEFQKLNDERKVSELSEKIRNSYEKIEWQVIEHKFEVPTLTIPGENGFERVNSIANFAEMIPNINKTEKLTDQLKEKYPIASIFPSTSFNTQQPTSHSLTDEEIRNSKIKTEFIRTIRMMESFLSVNVKKLETSNEITSDDYYDFLKTFGLHDKNSLGIIKQGIDRHFAEDYVSSIHILIPQIEYTLRELLRSRGLKTTRIESGIILNVLLDTMITRGESIYGSDMTNYLKIKFTDIDGLNERNNLSHAETDLSYFTHSISLSIIYVIIILTKLVIKV